MPDLFKPEERGHAGAEETSLNLALHPETVDMSKAADEKAKEHAIQEGVTLPLDTIDYTVSGVFGKSTNASEEKGEKVLETVVNELVKHVKMLKKMKIKDLIRKSKV